MESIAGAHLYGRRLVVEWAEQGDEGLDEIRAKTAAKFRGEDVEDFDAMPAKRRKGLIWMWLDFCSASKIRHAWWLTMSTLKLNPGDVRLSEWTDGRTLVIACNAFVFYR